MSNFAMGTILDKGFAQAQVHTNHSTSAELGQPKAKLHSLIVTLIKKCVIKTCQIASFMSIL